MSMTSLSYLQKWSTKQAEFDKNVDQEKFLPNSYPYNTAAAELTTLYGNLKKSIEKDIENAFLPEISKRLTRLRTYIEGYKNISEDAKNAIIEADKTFPYTCDLVVENLKTLLPKTIDEHLQRLYKSADECKECTEEIKTHIKSECAQILQLLEQLRNGEFDVQTEFKQACIENPKMIIMFFLHLHDDRELYKEMTFFYSKLGTIMLDIIPLWFLKELFEHRYDKDSLKLLYEDSSDERTTKLNPSAHFPNPYFITPLSLQQNARAPRLDT